MFLMKSELLKLREMLLLQQFIDDSQDCKLLYDNRNQPK